MLLGFAQKGENPSHGSVRMVQILSTSSFVFSSSLPEAARQNAVAYLASLTFNEFKTSGALRARLGASGLL